MRLRLGLALVCAAAFMQAAKPLDVYFVDVEGGQATLFVTPSKQSVLVDAGWPGFSYRDADRIAKAAKEAGVKAIDYLVITHYHMDHVGGVPQLTEKIPVRNFVDHGPNNETGKQADEIYKNYEEAAAKGKRITVKPGDTLPLKGDVQFRIVAANGDTMSGSGKPNPLCSDKAYPEDKSENARSVGMLITYGKFRIIDLGDLTSRKELQLVCPENKLGNVDVYLSTHHGMDISNAKEIVQALHPRVAVMNNGAKKGGTPAAWQTMKSSPGLEDIWQVHYSIAGKTENNSPESMIANLDEKCEGRELKMTAQQDGSFTVMNTRNKYTKNYPAR